MAWFIKGLDFKKSSLLFHVLVKPKNLLTTYTYVSETELDAALNWFLPNYYLYVYLLAL